jgi:hypothetical protein
LDLNAQTLFAKECSKLLEATLKTMTSCYKTKEEDPDLYAMYAANMEQPSIQVWNDKIQTERI